jgi:hypothetical protein
MFLLRSSTTSGMRGIMGFHGIASPIGFPLPD